MKKDIRDLSYKELQNWLTSINEPEYRARQIFLWLYQKRVNSFKDMKNLPAGLTGKLQDNFSIFLPEIVKRQASKIDGTTKYLLNLADGEVIETVLIPSGKRLTACLSTQVGCRYRCKFCASGLYGFKRNLSQAEILSQLIIIKDKINNIVFMGIGEPLDNFSNLIGAIKIINDKNGFNIGARRITISTAGVIDKIKELAGLGLQIELSVSLHTADNKKRSELMTINRIYPLEMLIKTLKEYYQKTKRLITFEYIVIKNTNDGVEDAKKMVRLIKGLKCKVNLIPFSPVEEIHYQRPDMEDVTRFRDILDNAGIPVTIRMSKGLDISAACGQLRIKNISQALI